MTGIYLITNLITKEYYIGQSVDIERRFKQHKDNMYKLNYPLYKDMRFYGLDNFSFEVLELCTKELLNYTENFYINQFLSDGKFLYNIKGDKLKEAQYVKRRRNKRSTRKYK